MLNSYLIDTICNMKKVELYTDGACSGNPGVGGWGVVLIYGDYIKEFSGVNNLTTNNQMEITAVIEGLKRLKEACDITIYTDSAYTMNAFSEGWITNWQLNGWKTANKKPVKNAELWQELLNELAKHKVKWVKVKGHADNKYNNICDKLATGEIAKYNKTKVIDIN